MSLLRPAAQATYEKVFRIVYTGLLTNVLVAVSVSPVLFALAVVRDPLGSWPFFAALSVVCAPAITGAFACFATLDDDTPRIARTYWDTYRRTARRAAACWLAGAAATSILAVDAAVVLDTRWGPALVLFFTSAAVLVVATTIAVLTRLAAADAPLRNLVWPCLCLITRRWYLAVADVLILLLAATFVLAAPVPGLLVGCAPLLYVVWTNTRFATTQ